MNRTRTLITKGVYSDKFGIAIIVSVNGKPREFRWELDQNGKKLRKYVRDATHDTAWFKAERIRVQAREQLKGDVAKAKAHSLQADVSAYLKTLSGRTKEDADDLLAHWTSHFGERARHTLTVMELRQHAATWTYKGKPISASTFNHRRQALISVYVALDGKTAPNPVREIPKRRELVGAPRALTYDVITAALKKMPRTKSRARLMLLAYTGIPHAQIKRLTPDDWQGTLLRVTPRRKGAGASGRWLPLSPDAQAAMKEFAALEAWGPFSNSSLYKAWKAVAPKGAAPYALRHSWITELYKRSNGDMLALQELSIHSRLEQTKRYAAAGLEDRMAALVVPRNHYHDSRGSSSKRLRKSPVARTPRKEGHQREKSRKTTKSARK